MKRLFFAISVVAATVFMASCKKGESDTSASIVGSWELTKSEISATDKDGKTVDMASLMFDMMKKSLGTMMSDAEIKKIADESAKDLASASEGLSKISFGEDGKMTMSTKDEDGKWVESEGTYKLSGTKLDMTQKEGDDTVTLTATVLSLTSTELKIQMSSSEALQNYGDEITTAIYKEIFGNYSIATTSTFKRL